MSRLTFSDQIQITQDSSGKDTSTASQTFFKRHINSRDNFCVSKLPNWLTELSDTFTTEDGTQYYDYFPNTREIESLTITIGSVDYPLTPVHSNQRWIELNAIDIQAGAIPQHYFKRQQDFGIWPIPQDAYTATVEYSVRGGGLVRTDYTTGTITTINGDETVEGSGTTWNSAATIRPGDWLTQTDSNGEPVGSWYQIDSVTDADTLELEYEWNETAISTATYKIGQCSVLPPEYQELPAYGALMDYYMGFRQSPTKATYWSNMFYTGDPAISRNSAENDTKPWLSGGLLGLINDYRDRNKSQLVRRSSRYPTIADKRWASSIS